MDYKEENDAARRQYDAICAAEPFAEYISSCAAAIAIEYLAPTPIVFSPLQHSVLTAQGRLSNTDFHEKDMIIVLEPTKWIKAVVSNYGEKRDETYAFPRKGERKSLRGRKPKTRKPPRRQVHGTGITFNSQISLWTLSATRPDKIYKIKVFRNGSVEIPGGLCPDMTDVRTATEHAAAAIGEALYTDVKLTQLYSVMRNYKCKTIGEKVRVNIRALYDIWVRDKMSGGADVAGVDEIIYNPERYPGLIIKFPTPIPRNPTKQLTLKLFKSGKVNIDGANDGEAALGCYWWVTGQYLRYEREIIYEFVDDPDDDAAPAAT